MTLRLTRHDLAVIGHYLGSVLSIIALSMLVPALLAIVFGEFGELPDFLIGFGATLVFATFLRLIPAKSDALESRHAVIVTGLAWIVGSFFSAIPLILSGHYVYFVDALLEAVSGYTTTGLSVVRDLDHMSVAMNMWRFEMQFLGGQGVLVAALAIGMFAKNSSVVATMYRSEGRSEHIMPNIRETGRFIWTIASIVIAIGTVSTGLAVMLSGVSPVRAFFHGLWLSISAFDTGGFAPQMNSVMYYQSVPVEVCVTVIGLLGVVNFTLFGQLVRGRWSEMFRDIESRTFFYWTVAVTVLAVVALIGHAAFSGLGTILRRLLFIVLAAVSNTGFMNVYSSQITVLMTSGTIFAIILAMTVGGSSGSTSGGIKTIRLGIVMKTVARTVHETLLPDSALSSKHYHHVGNHVLHDDLVSEAYTITILYIIVYILGAVIGIVLGYEPIPSSFESVSAASNTGLTSGLLAVDTPALLKITYIVEMLMGRFEFITIIAVIMSFLSTIVPKRVSDRVSMRRQRRARRRRHGSAIEYDD